MKKPLQILFMSLVAIFVFTSTAHAEWNFGIGTGLSLVNIKGEQGFNTPLLGPVKFDVELDPEDFNDITKTAIGFGGYAANGPWLIQYQFAQIELEDSASTYLPLLSSTATVEINFKTTGAEATVGYPVIKTSSLILMVDAGARYTKHEFDSSLTVTGAVTGRRDLNLEHDWTDAILGVTLNVPFASQWTWNTRANAGFGGSEGTYFVSTGLNWRFHKNWAINLIGKYALVEYENGSMGDSDWYLYDVDESSAGLNVVFNW